MELKTYLEIIWRRKIVIIFAVAVTTMLAVIMASRLPTEYTATSTMRVSKSSAGFENLSYTERLMRTYASILTSDSMSDQLNAQLGYRIPTNHIEIDFPPNTELMQVKVTDSSPVRAAESANMLAELLISQSRVTRNERDYTVDLIGMASPPENPDTSNAMLLLALGVMGGLGAGIGLAFLWENLDNSVHSAKEIEQATGLTTLGLIPVVPGKRVQGFLNGNSLEGEAFHILRASLFAIERDTQINTLLVTSANPGAGKSTVIANLALAMAHVGRKIVVVDGDLRLPAQHERFQLPNKTGLGDFLEGNAALPDIIQKSQIDGVDVITSGALPENPAELLSSAPMTELLNQLSVQYDLVLVDAPALLSVSDASSLSLIVDAVLLVVSYDQADHKDLQSVRQRLTTLKARPVGIVVNKSARDESSRYYQRT